MRSACVGLAVGGLVGCTGEVDVFLADTSETPPGGELELRAFELPLDHVEAHIDGEWVALTRGPDPYNLLDFSGEAVPVDLLALREAPVRIAHDELPVGSIDALRLRLMPGEALTVTTEVGVSHALTVPDDAAWEVRTAMEIAPDGVAERTLDLHVRACIVVEEGGSWSFVPALGL